MNINWITDKRRIDELKHWDRNPRKISKEAFEKLKERIVQRGMHDVLKIDTDNTVLSGNQRLDALKELNIVAVYVMVPDRALTDEERDKIALESNIEDGEYDFSLLGDRFDSDLLSDIGFSTAQIERAFDLKTSEDEFDADAEVGRIEAPKTERRQIYQLGEHRLMCGDSTDLDDVNALMGGDLADLVFTDPPYSINYSSKEGNSYSSGKFASEPVFDDKKTPEQALEFYEQVLENLNDVTKTSAPIYWWFADKMAKVNQEALENTGWLISQRILWLKTPQMRIGLDFLKCYEPAFYGWKSKNKRWTNKDLPNLRDVWTDLSMDDFQDHLDIWFEKRDQTSSYVHPTQKPVQLAERALRNSCPPGGIVLDVFGGSGSTLIACQQMGRKAYLMELDPKYCDAIIKRWEELTGQHAVLL